MSLIMIATFLLYAPTLRYGFLDFDDGVHVTADPVIRSLEAANIREMFTRTISGVYIPLTSLSFAFEYRFFGLDPFIYHLNNVLLYILLAPLTFWLARRMELSLTAAAIAAFLFLWHPMHVESVAWVSERKDMLYMAPFIGALIAYTGYLKEGKRSSYGWALVLGLASMLAKPTAATLPGALLLLDLYFRRPLSRGIILDKIPFCLYILPLIWITYSVHPHPPLTNIGEAILVLMWSFSFYVTKFFVPVHLAPFYPFVEPVSILEPSYALAVTVTALFGLLLVKYRKDRLAVFAFLFCAASLVIILRYGNMLTYGNNTMVADRYMFQGGLGFCLLLGRLFADWLDRRRKMALIALGILLTAFAVKTIDQSRIWRDDLAFFSAAIEECPTCYRLYVSRWKAYKARGDEARAAADYRRAAALKRQQFISR